MRYPSVAVSENVTILIICHIKIICLNEAYIYTYFEIYTYVLK